MDDGKADMGVWLYRIAIGLHALLVAYFLMWLVAIAVYMTGDIRARFLGIDMANALTYIGPLEILAVYVAGFLVAAGFVFALRRSSKALIAIAGVVLIHLPIWVNLLFNPYYSGGYGYIAITAELSLATMLAILWRRGTLR